MSASVPVGDAERWLALVDSADYAASWSAAGTTFRDRVTEDAWAGAAGSVRKPLGAVVSRALLDEQSATTLPGAPDGDYRMIRFTTAFANKKAAIETVVLLHETAGWCVVGYFVK